VRLVSGPKQGDNGCCFVIELHMGESKVESGTVITGIEPVSLLQLSHCCFRIVLSQQDGPECAVAGGHLRREPNDTGKLYMRRAKITPLVGL
jgi:hypothetical protein